MRQVCFTAPTMWLLWGLMGCDRVSWLADTVHTPPSTTAQGSGCDADGAEAVGVLTTWCLPCHSATVVGEGRSGAPVGLDFDTPEGVRRWAGAALARVDGPAPSMPPAGGMPSVQREALVAWLVCDAPEAGDFLSPAEDPCAARVVWEAGSDETLCPGHNVVVGDLVVDEGADLGCLCEVEGDLVTGSAASLDAPLLRRVGGAVHAEGSFVRSVSLPSLTEAGSVWVGSASALESVRLPVLVATDAFELGGAPALVHLGLDRLTLVEGPLRLADAPRLLHLDSTNSLLAVEGDLELDGLGLVMLDDFARLERVGGDVLVGSMPSLRSVWGFQVASEVEGDLVIRDNPVLTLWEGFQDLERVGGTVELTHNATLRDMDALHFLAQAGGLVVTGPLMVRLPPLDRLEVLLGELTIADNPRLLDLEGLGALTRVSGTMTVARNDTLASLQHLRGLTSIGGDLIIVDNPALPDDAVDRLVSAVDHIEGDVIVE